ncbi:hypothetical protein BGZ96_003856, partial [Linnemannia gamsii]
MEIGVITPEWQQQVKKEMQQKSRLKGHTAFLSQDFLQYLGARMPGYANRSNKDKASHADWDQALRAMYADDRPDVGAEVDVESDDSVAPLNRNATNISNALMREFATNINNIWSGSIYHQLRRYVIRYLLRINLRPISEQNYRENKRQRAINKAEERKLKSDTAQERGRATLRAWRRRNMDLLISWIKPSPPGARTNESTSSSISLGRIWEASAMLPSHTNMNEYEFDSDFEESDAEDSDFGEEDDQKSPSSGSNVENSAYSSVSPKTKEPSSQKLKGLEAVSIKLLDSADTLNGVTDAMVREELYNPELYTAEDIGMVTRMVTLLTPFTPKRTGPGPDGAFPRHILTTGPFAYLANSILRASGYSDFTRRLCPVHSVGHRHALPLDATGMYEVFYGPDPDWFDVVGPNGRIISSAVATRMSLSHKDAMFSAFLDRGVIDEVCKAHGLHFAQRLIYVDRYTVRIQGRQIKAGPNRQPVTSAYDDKRKKKQNRPGFIDWCDELSTSGHTRGSAKAEADRQKVEQEALIAKLKPLRKNIQVAEAIQRDAEKVVRESKCASNVFRSALYKDLKCARVEVRTIRQVIIPMENQLRAVKQARNYYNKLSKTKSAASTTTPDQQLFFSRPTVEHPGLQDYVETVCIDDLCAGLIDVDHQLAPSGTDRGLVVMSETVSSLWSTLGSLSNRYHALYGHPDTQDTSLDPSTTTPQESAQESNMDDEGSTAPAPGLPFAPNTPILPHQRKRELQFMKFTSPNRITSRHVYE